MPKAQHCRHFLTMLERTTKFQIGSYKNYDLLFTPVIVCGKTETKKYDFKIPGLIQRQFRQAQ